jgi:septal ring factor EnvC (AmiA/AmiB activator)
VKRVLLLLLALACPAPFPRLAAQDPDLQSQILESQRRLEAIRAERARLQQQMEEIRAQVRDASQELRNIEQQLTASRLELEEMELQAEITAARADQTTAELYRTQEELTEGKAVLNRRVRDIYKRGPLHSLRVLLGAESFADLLTRYRYLQKIAAYDRSLVDGVEESERRLRQFSQELEVTRAEEERLQQAMVVAMAELQSVERDQQSVLARFEERERQTESRLEQLEADEGQLTNLIDDLERRRLEEERRRALAGLGREGPGTLSGADAGSLDWPVEGELVYRFGLERRPNGTVLRWNGIGIGAPQGEPVQAVKAGTVVLAGPFEGYGPTVILDHGGGFYTLYLYLEDIGVVQGRQVQAGQVVGTVGGAQTPEGPHIEFQIRAPVAGGTTQAMDPLQWLKGRNPIP